MKMTKLDKLKAHLKRWHEQKNITEATDICTWLYKELITEAKDETTQ